LLLLARAARALAAMAAGMADSGAAASEAMARAALAGPAVLLVIFALALPAGTSNIDAVAAQAAAGFAAPRALALAALAIAAYAMIRRDAALQAEQSGWLLALAAWAASLRLLAWLSLLAALFLPWGMTEAAGLPLLWPFGAILWAVKLAALAALLAAAETLLVVPSLPRLLGVAAALAGLAVLLLCAAGQGAT